MVTDVSVDSASAIRRQDLAELITVVGQYATVPQGLERQESITVDRILVKPWDPARLENARAAIRNGIAMPPITVSGYNLHGDVWYIPENGHHRAAAAAEAGKRKIVAHVMRVVKCDFANFIVRGGKLWRADEDGSFFLMRDGLRKSVLDLAMEFGAKWRGD